MSTNTNINDLTDVNTDINNSTEPNARQDPSSAGPSSADSENDTDAGPSSADSENDSEGDTDSEDEAKISLSSLCSSEGSSEITINGVSVKLKQSKKSKKSKNSLCLDVEQCLNKLNIPRKTSDPRHMYTYIDAGDKTEQAIAKKIQNCLTPTKDTSWLALAVFVVIVGVFGLVILAFHISKQLKRISMKNGNK